MRKLRIAAALAVAALASPAAAQVPDHPAAEGKPAPKSAPRKAHRAPKSAAAKPGLAEPAFIVPPPAGAADSSLERRRRGFFARPDDVGTSSESTPPVGVTLGGSGGITPGMGFKF